MSTALVGVAGAIVLAVLVRVLDRWLEDRDGRRRTGIKADADLLAALPERMRVGHEGNLLRARIRREIRLYAPAEEAPETSEDEAGEVELSLRPTPTPLDLFVFFFGLVSVLSIMTYDPITYLQPLALRAAVFALLGLVAIVVLLAWVMLTREWWRSRRDKRSRDSSVTSG